MREFGLARKLNKRLFGVLVESIPVAELPADLTDTWQLVDLASGQDHLMMRVTLPRTHQEVHVTFSKEGLARLRNGLTRAGLDSRFFAWPPEHDLHRPPFRGLKPLEGDDAGIFFGRDAPIVEALDTLRGAREAAPPRLLVILGASGAGKSSFLRAGLLPRLARDDRNFLPLPVIRPERAAISGESGLVRAIEVGLAAHGLQQSRASIRNIVAAGSAGLRPVLLQLVEKISSAGVSDDGETKRPAILFAIDQAEELFLSDGAEEGQKLLALIRDLVAEDHPEVIVVFTVRSDSYDQLEGAKIFEGLRQQAMPLLPMPRGAYQTVIEGPATRLRETDRALSIEPRLTQALLEDIEKGRRQRRAAAARLHVGAALSRIWRKRRFKACRLRKIRRNSRRDRSWSGACVGSRRPRSAHPARSRGAARAAAARSDSMARRHRSRDRQPAPARGATWRHSAGGRPAGSASGRAKAFVDRSRRAARGG